LRGFAESLVSDVEKACWDYVLAKRRIAIFADSLKLAEDQLRETEERIKVGKLAEVEVYAAQAEVALRHEALINARSDLALSRLRLQRLLNQQWTSEISVADKPTVPDVKLDDVGEHVQVALRWRPELNQAKLAVKREDLEIAKTKNGLLPVMDLFITMGKTGYADSFGGSADDLDGESYDIAGGITFAYPISRRAARARHKRSTLSRQQSQEALLNLAQLIEVDVRSAFIEISRAREQVTATAATRKLQEESVRGETEKFRVGKSTTLLVAQAQRDLVSSQIAEIEAMITYLKALIELYRLEGSLLERRGITAPGREPVDLALDNRE
jgi:outer membrane protein TolC